MARDTEPTDGYTDRILKLLPAELTGAYLAVRTIIGPDTGDKDFYILIFGLILLVIAPFFLFSVLGVRKFINIVFLTVSFFIWCLNIDVQKLTEHNGEIITAINAYAPSIGTLSGYLIEPVFVKGLLIVCAIVLVPMVMMGGREPQ